MKYIIKGSVVFLFAAAVAMSGCVSAEPAKAESAKTELAKVEPAKAEPAKVESAKTELAKVEPAKAEPAKVEPAKAELSKVKPTKVEPTKADLAKAEPAMAGAPVGKLLEGLNSAAAKADDPELQSLAGEWGSKIMSLGAAMGDNPQVQGYLSSAVQGVLGDNAPAAMAAMQKLTGLDYSGDTMNLVKQVADMGGAYLMQKNFGGMEGSKETVSKIVGALKEGNYMAAAAPLKELVSGDNLSDEQKALASSMLESYVPGADAAKDMMNKVKGL